MNRPSHPLRWLPPLIVGVCAATAAEVAVALLLYSGPGFMRSLTAVLAVEAGALGVGLWAAPVNPHDLVDALRRRWLFCLGAFLAAAVFAAGWSVLESVGGTGVGQGLGLALLAGLPLYGIGGVLGTMGMMAAARPEVGSQRSVAGTAALGASLGFAVTGAFLTQVFVPASLLLVCVVLLSGGGLVYGAVLDGEKQEEPTP